MWLLESPRPVNPERYRILSGPERIETGWWEAPAGASNGLAPSMAGRDYFIASDAEGARCWLFKFRSPNPSDEAEPWYLHGYFA